MSDAHCPHKTGVHRLKYHGADMDTSAQTLAAGQFLKTAEVMKLFGFTNRTTFWQFVKRAGVPYVALGQRTMRFEASALRSYINARSVGHVPTVTDQGGAAA